MRTFYILHACIHTFIYALITHSNLYIMALTIYHRNPTLSPPQPSQPKPLSIYTYHIFITYLSHQFITHHRFTRRYLKQLWKDRVYNRAWRIQEKRRGAAMVIQQHWRECKARKRIKGIVARRKERFRAGEFEIYAISNRVLLYVVGYHWTQSDSLCFALVLLYHQSYSQCHTTQTPY